MKRTCQYCNSPLFDTDTICWHCGQQQPLPVKQESPSKQTISRPVAEEDPEPELKPVGSALILFYGSLMVIIVLALLLITRSLGQSPILVMETDSTRGDWVSLTAPDKSFSIEIPATWDWHFKKGRVSSSFTELLENDDRIVMAVLPFGNFVPDTEYLLVAQNDTGLLIIARSERLKRLSPQQAVASLQAENFDNLTVSETRLVQTTSAEEMVSITITHTDPPLRCDQHLVTGPIETYLVAACSVPENYDWQQGTFSEALNSFDVRSR